jgi:hypothetical protein
LPFKNFWNILWSNIKGYLQANRQKEFNLDKLTYITEIICDLDGNLSFCLLNGTEYKIIKELNIFKVKDFIISFLNGNSSINFDNNIFIIINKLLAPQMLNLVNYEVKSWTSSQLKEVKKILDEISEKVSSKKITIEDSKDTDIGKIYV